MPQYKAPIEDMQFILHDWLKITDHYQATGYEETADASLVNAILEESAKFSEEVLSPLNHLGDQQGCQIENSVVTTPEGFKESYQQFCEAGWSSLAASPDFGGQGLPYSLSVVAAEMSSSANASWGMYPGLTHGAISALEHHAEPELQQAYLPKLISGEWTGTMCLTESHCGSDLGLLKTKAQPQNDGSYLLSGSKIFISAGEHDMSKNIIHLVLARLPDAPAGTNGISLFLVPKILDVETAQNNLTDNNVTCSAIEHKMGIKASATCVINFDEAKGFLIGEPNQGLRCMFTMMNKARLGTAIQGYAIAELAKQGSLDYAKDRLQMRSLSGPKAPEKPADPIIVHPDVKRMLFTQKAIVEGCRGLAYYVATLVDKVETDNDPDGAFGRQLDLLTPICKAFMTELGLESTNHAVQVLGGHGYISEWELEQLVRDCRITLIYEGTNGIQSLDFLGRKVLRDQGKALTEWIQEIGKQCAQVSDDLKPLAASLGGLCQDWGKLTGHIAQQAQQNMDEVGAAAFDFLMYSGYITIGHVLLQQANSVTASEQSDAFKQAKRQTAEFFFKRVLPRVKMHSAAIMSGNSALQCSEFEL